MSDWSECTIVLTTSLSCLKLVLNEEGEELLCLDTGELDRAFDLDVHEKLLLEEVGRGCVKFLNISFKILLTIGAEKYLPVLAFPAFEMFSHVVPHEYFRVNVKCTSQVVVHLVQFARKIGQFVFLVHLCTILHATQNMNRTMKKCIPNS